MPGIFLSIVLLCTYKVITTSNAARCRNQYSDLLKSHKNLTSSYYKKIEQKEISGCVKSFV